MRRRLVILCLATIAGLAVTIGHRRAFPRTNVRPNFDGLATAQVGRKDLFVTLTAGGRIESENDTVISCELENLQFSSQGRSISAGAATTILSIVPDGTKVHRDEVLCRLDSSEYEELVRQQQLKVETSRADLRRAELELEIARAALLEFRDGLQLQKIQQYQGSIALAESELTRARDRFAWSSRMLQRRYLPPSQAAVERDQRLRAELNLASARRAYRTFVDYGARATLRTLQCQIDSAESTLTYQNLRLKRQMAQLANFEKQVERCTIRAPHDGFLVYAPGPDGVVRVEEGAKVRQKQNLFRLPDLTRMEVRALLHETIVDRVRKGMRARVRIEALASRAIEGRVTDVAQLPLLSRNALTGTDVKNYEGRVVLDASPEGLRPGMSAEVRIDTEKRPDALVIPTEALAVEDGREVCYVAGEDGLERREVEVNPATPELLEVSEGLREGERVVLHPDPFDPAQARAFESLRLDD